MNENHEQLLILFFIFSVCCRHHAAAAAATTKVDLNTNGYWQDQGTPSSLHLATIHMSDSLTRMPVLTLHSQGITHVTHTPV